MNFNKKVVAAAPHGHERCPRVDEDSDENREGERNMALGMLQNS